MSYTAPDTAAARPDTMAETPVSPAAPVLGPALVTAVRADGVWMVRPLAGDAPSPSAVPAVPAMPFVYTPREGDTVLAIGQSGRWYVIGVLNGQGDMTINAPADLSLVAAKGTVRVTAQAVEVRTPRLETVAAHIAQTARAIVTKAHDLTQWVTGAMDVRAGNSTLNVDGVHTVHAEHCLTQARKCVRVDGELILHG